MILTLLEPSGTSSTSCGQSTRTRSDGLDDLHLSPAQTLLRKLLGVLGLQISRVIEQPAGSELAAAPFIDILIELRSDLRHQKLWALSDQIRDKLAKLDVLLEDSKDGTGWHWSQH